MPRKKTPNRKLTASWEFELEQDLLKEYIGYEDEEPLSEEDEIIERLKKTPQERQAEKQARDEKTLHGILAKEIQKEIDAEILEELMKEVKDKGVPFDKKE